MFSRLAVPLTRKAFVHTPKRNPWMIATSAVSTTVDNPKSSAVSPVNEERDLVNFPQPVQREFGGKVRLGFLPDEWFQFFYRKTGVTGPYLFGAGLVTFLCSKEWYIMEHEFYTGVGLVILWTFVIKKYGNKIAAFTDKLGDEEIARQEGFVERLKQDCREHIKYEETEQWRSEAQVMIFEAKRENISLQLEAEYRKRMLHTYTQVKKILDYHVQSINVTRQVHHKHMVNWVIDNVVRSITPQQEEEALKKCITDLKTLSLA